MKPRALIPLVVFVAIGFFLYSGIGKDPRYVPSPLVGKPMPEFSAPALHDPTRIVSKTSLLGTPYLLNVFGSWCPSCRVEHPILAEYARRGAFKLVGFNWKDEKADAERWLQQFGDPYAEIFTDLDGRLGIDFGVYGAPETFVIGADGMVLHKHVGPLDAQTIEKEILPLLAGKP
ncbi:MAG: DsbE family thiol:disulfide interchange protein [Rhodanobacteraceae bacterium]|nr:DsbE family thiol:disulfide interchange protein [Rhodanobacteraceae bacterium]